jgi:uncharacterized membrane protein
MGTIEERVQVLENRVRELEYRLGLHYQAPLQDMRPPVNEYYNNQQPQPQLQQQPTHSEIPQANRKFGEAVVGKYIIGALASLLIFVAAISLISLVWNKMSPEVKLSLLVAIGLILTTIGFIRVRKHKNPISSIILGTGSGLLFIDILAANMAFDMISNNLTLLLVGLWTILFIYSYRFTQLFFTIVIAYIGYLIALLLGLTLFSSEMDYFMLIVFACCIIAVMLANGYKRFDYLKQLVSIIFSFVSVGCLLLVGTIEYELLINNWFYFVILLVIILQALTIRIFYLFDQLKLSGWSLLIGTIASILTMYGLNELDVRWYVAIFILVLLVQIFLLEWLGYKSTVALTKMYSGFIIWGIILLGYHFNDYIIGISLAATLLVLLDMRKRTSRYDLFAGGIVLLETAFLFMNSLLDDKSLLLNAIAIIVCLGTISYILYKKYHSKNATSIVALKMICFVSFMSNLFIYVLKIQFRENDLRMFSGYSVPAFFSITVLLVVFYISGFFGDWTSLNFKWFSNNTTYTTDKSVIALYIMTTGLYIIGLSGIDAFGTWYEQLGMIACVLCIALIQSANLLKSKHNKDLIGFWLGLKYCIIVWVVIEACFNQSIDSLVYSVSGLILALLCIIIGFQIKTKSLRLYGLILTVLMVIKFILVDLSQENSITRVLALVAGGLICFGISVLYNKLNVENIK